MSLGTHRITEETFVQLAGGGGDVAALRQVALGRRSRNLLLLRALVRLAMACGHPDAAAAQVAYRSLEAIERHAPDDVAAVIHYPMVGAWALRTVIQLRSDQWADASPGFLAAVAAAAAVRGAVRLEVDLRTATRSDGRVMLPSLGTAVLADEAGGPRELPGPMALRWGPEGAELGVGNRRIGIPADPHQTTGGWRGLPLISAECEGERINLLLDVLEPEDGPDSIAAGRELADPMALNLWRVWITDGWRLLVRHHREAAAEFAAVIRVLAPLTTGSSGFVSATPNDAFGCIAMSRPRDAMSVALTFAHEIQHVKLNAIMDLFPLVEAGFDARFYAPWRVDPRPAIGLLHGAYAHLGVAGFWRKQRNHMSGADALHAHTEFARWRAAARDVARFLASSGCLTPLGRRFAQGMRTTLDKWIDEDVPAEAAKVAQRLAGEHRATWRAAHGEPGN